MIAPQDGLLREFFSVLSERIKGLYVGGPIKS